MHRFHLAALVTLCSLSAGCSLLFSQSEGQQGAKDDGGIGDGGGSAVDAQGDGGGPLLDAIVTLTNGAFYAADPSVVYDGTNYRVVWEDGRDGAQGEVYAATVGTGMAIPITTNGGTQPASVWTGNSELLIAWVDGRDDPAPDPIYAGRYADDYKPIGAEIIVSAALDSNNFAPSLTSAGSQIGVAWSDLEPTPYVVFAKLNNTGTVTTDAATFQIQASNSTIAYNGSVYGIAWHGTMDTQIHFGRMAPSGTLAGEVLLSSSGEVAQFPVVAALGSDFGVAWEEEDTSAQASLYFVSVSASGAVGTSVLITPPDSSASRPAITASENAYGVAWQDSRSGRSEIYFREFDATGAPVSAELLLSEGGSASKEVSLVHAGGNEYAASWLMGPADNESVQFRRFTSR